MTSEDSRPHRRPEAAYLEVVERRKPLDADDHGPGSLILPNEVRINGTPLLVPADEAVTVHEISTRSDELVQVTLTLFVRRVVMGTEDADQ